MTTFTPQEEKVYAALSKILTNEFDIPAEKIRPEARLYEDFDIDSIDAVDMIVQLKPYLGNRTVKPEAFKAVRTLGDVVSVIAKIMEEPWPCRSRRFCARRLELFSSFIPSGPGTVSRTGDRQQLLLVLPQLLSAAL